MRNRTVRHPYLTVSGEICTYCGATAEVGDHATPVAHSNGYAYKDLDESMMVVVPACRSCNYILGARFFPSIAERAGYIAETLARKSAKLLASPAWDADDLEELGPSLLGQVSRMQQSRDETARRIDFAAQKAAQVAVAESRDEIA